MPKGRVNRWLLALLTLSTIANVWSWPEERRASENPPEEGGVAATTAAQPAAGSDTAARLALLQHLEEEHLRRARAVSDEFWATGTEYQSAYTQALVQGVESIREEIVESFGIAAKDDPLFRSLFRPLDPMYWFLTSDQQIAVQELRLERDVALQAAARSAAGPGALVRPNSVPAGSERAGEIIRKYQSDLAALLDDDVLVELELRDSTIAQQLRTAGLDLSESEFREIYLLLAEMQAAPANVDAFLDLRERLRGVLGDRRFAMLWAGRDPVFAQLKETAGQYALTDAAILAVYEVMNRFQDRRMRLAKTAEHDPGGAARVSMAIGDEERAAISQLVGEEVADEIVRSRALQSLRLFGNTGRLPQAPEILSN